MPFCFLCGSVRILWPVLAHTLLRSSRRCEGIALKANRFSSALRHFLPIFSGRNQKARVPEFLVCEKTAHARPAIPNIVRHNRRLHNPALPSFPKQIPDCSSGRLHEWIDLGRSNHIPSYAYVGPLVCRRSINRGNLCHPSGAGTLTAAPCGGMASK